MRPFTIFAVFALSSLSSIAVMIGVLILDAPFMISMMRGTPRVTSNDRLRNNVQNQSMYNRMPKFQQAFGRTLMINIVDNIVK